MYSRALGTEVIPVMEFWKTDADVMFLEHLRVAALLAICVASHSAEVCHPLPGTKVMVPRRFLCRPTRTDPRLAVCHAVWGP